jgi:hypothetical protein
MWEFEIMPDKAVPVTALLDLFPRLTADSANAQTIDGLQSRGYIGVTTGSMMAITAKGKCLVILTFDDGDITINKIEVPLSRTATLSLDPSGEQINIYGLTETDAMLMRISQ